MKRYTILGVFLAALFCIFPSVRGWTGTMHPLAGQGRLDLTTWDFNRDGPVQLNGRWDFFWQVFLPPDPARPIPVPDSSIQVPGVWNGTRITGGNLPGQGFGSYRLVVALPPSASGLGLKFLDAATSFAAYVNGKKVYASGTPGKNRAATQPSYTPGVVPLPPLSGSMEILIHAANFHHWQGGLWEPVSLGRVTDLNRTREERLFFSTLLFGSILIMGLYHLFLYKFRPQDRSTLFFGLFCLLTALRPLLHGERILIALLPDLAGFSQLLRVNYISFYLSVPLFSHYLLTLFPRQISGRLVTGITWIWGLAALTPLVLPDTAFTALMPGMQVATICAVTYGCMALMLAIRRLEPDAGVCLFGFLLFFMTIVNDILYTRQIISTTHLVPAGLFLFILCQALILARRFSQAFATVNRQQQDLLDEINRRRQAEQELTESEKRFRTMADFMPIPLFETDVQFNVVYANNTALKWLGRPEEEITTGLPLTAVMAGPQDQTLDQLRRQIKEKREILLRKKGETQVWVQIETAPILINSRLTGYRVCVVDLTERKKAEAASLHEAEKNKYILVGQVAGKMAHDFNNILGAIMGNAEISLMDCQDPAIQESLEIILEQSQRGQMLTQNLVAFAKDQDPIQEFIDLNEMADKVLQRMERELDTVLVKKAYCEKSPQIWADPGMIEQSLVTLIQNAVQAMSLTPSPLLQVKTFVEKDLAGIEVADNGCGIPRHHHGDIYSPAFTLKGSRDKINAYARHIKGAGYGLANVKKVMDKHKGRILFTSDQGEGAAFTLTLPLKACPVVAGNAPSQSLQGVTGKNILVVEDESAISKVFFNILTHPPFDNRVTITPDGREAIEILDREKFDLISLDHVLAGSVTGMDVYHHIRQSDPETPIIFVSGNMAFIASIQQLIQEDSRLSHLSKPCDNLTYARMVEHWLVP